MTESHPRPWGFQSDELRWETHLNDAADFVGKAGHLPRRSATASAEERSLVYWIARQRLELRDQCLSDERIDRLDAELPGWRDGGRRSPRINGGAAS